MRGFLFAVTAIMLVSLLFTLAAVNQRNASEYSLRFIAAEKAAYAWTDVDEEIQYALNLNVTQNAENATFQDALPATINVSQSLEAYDAFIHNYYSSPGLNATFLPLLTQITPPIEILPMGISYGYPDWGKHQLQVKSPGENFSYIRSLTMRLNITSHWFDQNFTGACSGGGSDWQSYKTCGGGTTYCLQLDLRLMDANGTIYYNPCAPMDLDTQNVLWLNLRNNTGTEKINLQFGKMADTVFFTDLLGKGIAISSLVTLTLNTTEYSVKYRAQLRTALDAMNYSVTDRV